MSRHPYFTQFSNNSERRSGHFLPLDGFQSKPSDLMLPVRPTLLAGAEIFGMYLEDTGRSNLPGFDTGRQGDPLGTRSDRPSITIWHNPDDHAETFSSELGYFAWGQNVFAAFGCFFGGGALPSDGNWNLTGFIGTATISLLDAAGVVLLSSTMTGNLEKTGPTGSPTVIHSCSVANGAGQIPAFNAVRFSASMVGGPNDLTPVPGGSISLYGGNCSIVFYRGLPIDA